MQLLGSARDFIQKSGIEIHGSDPGLDRCWVYKVVKKKGFQKLLMIFSFQPEIKRFNCDSHTALVISQDADHSLMNRNASFKKVEHWFL